mgnify:CR=1 FL=1
MWVFKRVADIQTFLQKAEKQQLKIGFVPTMGALHRGHISLIEKCKSETDLTVCSIFVNPTQFNDKKDLDKYPRTIENDLISLENAYCDVLFLPETDDIYADQTMKHFNLGRLEEVFEGSSRPGHFQGVCQVVERLFDIVLPHEVFFGQKDYQQCMVINRLIDITPRFKNIQMNIVPTMREKSGLAMSSRNTRLTGEQREQAATIYKTLLFLKENITKDNLTIFLSDANRLLTNAGLKPDYISIANATTLEPVNRWDGITPLVALLAAFLGEVRLIDNMTLTD